MYSHSSLKDYAIIKKFILIANFDKHQVQHISTPIVFLLGTFTKKMLISAKTLSLQEALRDE